MEVAFSQRLWRSVSTRSTGEMRYLDRPLLLGSVAPFARGRICRFAFCGRALLTRSRRHAVIGALDRIVELGADRDREKESPYANRSGE